ncbi:hypothetical protein [Flavivirga algicola]|uniref:Uncharacterized protein n=1 Tax=Flavivirga algicola TaxID=2729136 RepID=A0ABX1RYE2_9FLAO|nr:hypothetical protein [Flavivirga algicola]NMH87519.1 hypothetical protein [Flavivirga algicola]
MKKLTLILFILVINFTMTSQEELIPLKVNNKWAYIKTDWINGKIVKKDTSYSFIKTSKIIDGKTWYVTNEDGYDYTIRDVNGEQFELDEEQNKTFLVFGLPKRENERSYMVNQEKVTVTKKLHKIKTRTSNFKCFKYEFRDPSDSASFIDTYICPGVGIVKVQMGTENEKTELTLIDYNIN